MQRYPVRLPIRAIPEGEDSLSPNRNPAIDSGESLLDAVAQVRELTGKPVGFKAVIGDYQWLHELCELIGQRGTSRCVPDFITIDSADGGTAAPASLIDYMGLPLKEKLTCGVRHTDAMDCASASRLSLAVN